MTESGGYERTIALIYIICILFIIVYITLRQKINLDSMAVLHRALFTWFNILIFLILLVLRLDQRIQWNWFIVFIPMWLYDNILLTYVIFSMISHCKSGHDLASSLRRKAWYTAAALLKTSTQILICLRLEVPHWNLPAMAILAPFWILLPALAIDVFIHLIHYSSY